MSAASCLQGIRVLRVLCREEFSVAAAKTFVDDLKRAMQWLTGHYMYTPEQVCPPPPSSRLHAKSHASLHAGDSLTISF